MSRRYKFHNQEGIYFVSFATVNWISVFVREEYFTGITESLEYCRKNKGMLLFAWCILPNHIHLIFKDKNNNSGKLLKEFKTFTSKHIQKLIVENPSRPRL